MENAIIIITGICTVVGTALTSWVSIRQNTKVIDLRLASLEKKQDKHNNLIERMAVVEKDLKNAHYRIGRIEDGGRK